MRTMTKYMMFLAAVSIVGCTMEQTELEPIAEGPAPADKILNTSECADPASLVVRLTEKGHAGISDMETAFLSLGVESCRRVFPYSEATEDIYREKGLDKWYVLRLEDGTDAACLAEKLSVMDGIESIEFNTLMSNDPQPSVSIEPGAVVPTRSSAGYFFNDPMLKDQWHYSNNGDYAIAPNVKKGADARVVDAWKLETGSPEIIVAVIDDAVQYNHPDLAANMWHNEAEFNGVEGVDDDGNGFVDDVYGYNFAQGKGQLDWTLPGATGHGTHVAGTVAAVNNNGEGVSGVAGGSGQGDGVRIMSCQLMGGFVGGGDAVSSALAIAYAAQMGAHIIQCSWGYDTFAPGSDNNFISNKNGKLVADALELFFSKPNDVLDGGIAIFASGNTGKNVVSYPGAYGRCISVTSFAADGLPAYYTAYGAGANISAPGGEYGTGGGSSANPRPLVISTMPTQPLDVYKQGTDGKYYTTGEKTATYYGGMQGTSMACPHVSGIAALGLSYAKRLGKTFTADEFVSLLLSSVNGFGEFPLEKKYVSQVLPLQDYQDRMGTGMIDAWKFLMNIDGTPMLSVKCGEERHYDLSGYFGGDASRITYISCDISPEDKEALGLKDKPVVEYGRLCIHPTKIASAKIKVKAVAGGNIVSDPDHIGGHEITREISVLSRDVVAPVGGWL